MLLLLQPQCACGRPLKVILKFFYNFINIGKEDEKDMEPGIPVVVFIIHVLIYSTLVTPSCHIKNKQPLWLELIHSLA